MNGVGEARHPEKVGDPAPAGHADQGLDDCLRLTLAGLGANGRWWVVHGRFSAGRTGTWPDRGGPE